MFKFEKDFGVLYVLLFAALMFCVILGATKKSATENHKISTHSESVTPKVSLEPESSEGYPEASMAEKDTKQIIIKSKFLTIEKE